MPDPILSLLIAGVLITGLLFLFWPDRGYFWKWRKLSSMNNRVLIEDTLKHLYDAEYAHRAASVQSLAGALEISGNRAADLLKRTESLDLIQRAGDAIRLTAEGRNYALRIIRLHRLWERYLAEETSVKETEWHHLAEHQEHWMSDEQANALAAQMGEPSFDPHGDPIPTASGEVPPRRGQPLATLPENDIGVIVHLEDEPDEVYAQLVAEGLHTGMQVQVTNVSPERIRFWANGDERVLAPICAANISVVPLPKDVEKEGPFETLSTLKTGEKARVLRLSRMCRGLERRRLMDLGVLPGTAIEVEMRSASGDPTAYRVRGTLIALRKEQADQIHIDRLQEMVS